MALALSRELFIRKTISGQADSLCKKFGSRSVQLNVGLSFGSPYCRDWLMMVTTAMNFVCVGNPVEVGITMYVSSVSHISEVNMVSLSEHCINAPVTIWLVMSLWSYLNKLLS